MQLSLYEILAFVTDWVSRLVLATLLWALLTCAGGIILGFMPSTAAMFDLMYRWETSSASPPMFRTYIATFKRDFVRSNVVGLSLGIPSLMASLNFYYCFKHPSLIAHLILSSTIAITILLCVILLYIFPVMSHFKVSPTKQLGLALILGLKHPFRTLWLLLVVGFFVFFMRGLIPFLLVSLLCLFITRVVYPCFVSDNPQDTPTQ